MYPCHFGVGITLIVRGFLSKYVLVSSVIMVQLLYWPLDSADIGQTSRCPYPH